MGDVACRHGADYKKRIHLTKETKECTKKATMLFIVALLSKTGLKMLKPSPIHLLLIR